MPTGHYDLHTHTTYSDGSELREMIAAAQQAGLDAIGLSDHCVVWDDPFDRSDRFDFHRTYEARRSDIEAARTEFEITVRDGVEMNYDPNYEDAIEAFLESAEFDYAIGSVHYAGEHYIVRKGFFADADDERKQEAVDTYIDWQVHLIESELFDVIGHLDLCERMPALAGFLSDDHITALIDALTNSSTIPEINGGKVFDDANANDPHLLERFRDAGIRFALGSDAHRPAEIGERFAYLSDIVAESDLALLEHQEIAGERE